MSESASGGPRPLTVFAVAGGLASLAVAQPILDLLARQPQFLVAHRLTNGPLVLAAVVLAAAPTLIWGTASALVSARATSRWWPAGMTAAPAVLVVMRVAVWLGIDGWVAAVLSLSAGLLLALAFARWPGLWPNTVWLAIVPVLILGNFALLAPRSLVATEVSPDGGFDTIDHPVPVVVLVFDELPLVSLIDSDGDLLSDVYPGFARLAADGVWYRNATTVATATDRAVPAILSGRMPTDGLLPTHVDHPETLLTLLADSHDVTAVEAITDLCPPSVCRDGQAGTDWRSTLGDVAVLYAHLVTPRPWDDRLPSIDQNWAGFGSPGGIPDWDLAERLAESRRGDRRQDVERFLAGLEAPTTRPGLRVAHFNLPHRPWEFLPDGSRYRYEPPDGYGVRGWGDDPYLVAQGWQRHLLQLGYVDTVLAAVLDRLESTASYEDALVVVTADHGVHFAPGVPDMRVTNSASLASIVPVPLFVKYPAGWPSPARPGTIDERPAETIDIVPTVLEVLGASPVPELDGISLLSEEVRGASVIEVRDERLPIDSQAKLDEAAGKQNWFPSGDPWNLVAPADSRHLVGAGIDDLPSGHQLAWQGEPPVIEGSVGPSERNAAVVLVADGQVVSITRPFADGRFVFLIEPSAVTGQDLQVRSLPDG